MVACCTPMHARAGLQRTLGAASLGTSDLRVPGQPCLPRPQPGTHAGEVTAHDQCAALSMAQPALDLCHGHASDSEARLSKGGHRKQGWEQGGEQADMQEQCTGFAREARGCQRGCRPCLRRGQGQTSWTPSFLSWH